MADIVIFSNCSPADYKKNIKSLNLNEQEMKKYLKINQEAAIISRELHLKNN